jgi:hypothetical protein
VVRGEFIFVRARPKWLDVATGNEVPFNKVRYQAGEIYPINPKGQWYSLRTHRFTSFGDVKK